MARYSAGCRERVFCLHWWLQSRLHSSVSTDQIQMCEDGLILVVGEGRSFASIRHRSLGNQAPDFSKIGMYGRFRPLPSPQGRSAREVPLRKGFGGSGRDGPMQGLLIVLMCAPPMIGKEWDDSGKESDYVFSNSELERLLF